MEWQSSEAETEGQSRELMADLLEAFDDALGGPMSLGEFLEILGWSVPVNSPDLSDIVAAPLIFEARVQGIQYQSRGPSRAFDLDDAAFVAATQLLAALASDAASRSGGPVSVAELPSLIADLLRSTEVGFADASGSEVELTAQMSKRSARPRIGDIVAIPARDGRHHMAVVVARNRFGTALGFFSGTFLSPVTDRLHESARDPLPRYTGEDLIASGAWRIVGRDEALADRFPAQPEIYHDPKFAFGVFGVDVGVFGAAETAEGTLRLIDRTEAEAVGLLDGTYRQCHPEESLQTWLDERLRL